MKISEYTINSAKTFKDREIGIDPQTTDLLHCVIGIDTEVGELITSEMEGFKDLVNVSEEVGDVMWYVANLARKINYDLSQITFPWKGIENRTVYLKRLVVTQSELMDHFKRGIYYYKDLDFNVISSKIDILMLDLYYFCNVMGIDFELCLQRNIDKLAKRYPGNFFTPEAALNRDLDGERKELEK